MNFYNDNDPQAAAWLRALIDAGELPPGVVDQRSIKELTPDDLVGFTQCHFFAGIGGWPLALHLAGWPTDRPVWTDSCPCQPFSIIGKRAGFNDPRHLWPTWFQLIRQCRPSIIFGEQVTGPAVWPWIDSLQADMEGMDYAFACVPFPAAGIGAPHIRDRTYWVGYANVAGLEGFTGRHQATGERRAAPGSDATAGEPMPMADDGGAHEVNGHWRGADWLACRDGRWRPVEPGTFPLADGIPARVGRLRGYGNAIVPQQAAAFIAATCAALAGAWRALP